MNIFSLKKRKSFNLFVSFSIFFDLFLSVFIFLICFVCFLFPCSAGLATAALVCFALQSTLIGLVCLGLFHITIE